MYTGHFGMAAAYTDDCFVTRLRGRRAGSSLGDYVDNCKVFVEPCNRYSISTSHLDETQAEVGGKGLGCQMPSGAAANPLTGGVL